MIHSKFIDMRAHMVEIIKAVKDIDICGGGISDHLALLPYL